MQDFNKAVAIKAALPPGGLNYDTLELQEAIVLYMSGAFSAGEQACAQAEKVTNVLSLVKDVCEKMQKAGTTVGYTEPDTKIGRQLAISARYPNLLTLHNPSELDAVIKLIGPSSQGFALAKGKDISLNATTGEYRMLLRYTKADGDYTYVRGGPFTIAEASTAHSETNITLPKHPKTESAAQKQFEHAQIAISDRPLNQVPHAAGPNAGFHLARAITGTERRIVSLSFNQDAHMLAVVAAGNLKIWDVNGGRELWNSPLKLGLNVAFSPDGKFLLWTRDDGVVELLEAETMKVVSQLGRSKGQTLISFSPDSRKLAFWWHDTIQVSDVSTGRMLYSITSKKDIIENVAFSPDGHWVASGGKNGIVFWDATDGRRMKDFTAGEFVAFSPDSQIVACASAQNITVWNLATGQVFHTLAGAAPIAFSQDSHWLASRSADRHSAKVWNIATGEEVASLGDPLDDLTSIAFSPDGQWLASGNEYDTVWLWRRSPRKDAGLQGLTSHDSTNK